MAKSRNDLRDSLSQHAQLVCLGLTDQMPAPMFLAVKILHRRGWPHSLTTVRRGHDKARRWQQRPKLPTHTPEGRGRALWVVPRRYPRSFGPWKLWRGLKIPCKGCRRATPQNLSRCRSCIQVATLWGSHVTQAEFHTYPEAVDAAYRAISCLERVARTPQGIQHEFLSRLTQLIARSAQGMRHTDDME